MKTLLPMLATAAAPFDSADYLFEVKWDGVRALAATEAGRWRLWGRQGVDYTLRYPELAVLGRLPAGTIVDGELVVWQDGRADFAALLRQHQRQRQDLFVAAAGRQRPASRTCSSICCSRRADRSYRKNWSGAEPCCVTCWSG